MADRMTKVFSDIYARGGWKTIDNESASGPGSTMRWTEGLREQLPRLFSDLGIKSVVDAPCGDFNWMKCIDIGDIEYIGLDVVPDLIENNHREYNSKNRSFYVLDITKDALPRADLILCRDFFIHMPYDKIWASLQNFFESEARFMLMSSYPKDNNRDLFLNGRSRPLNLEAEPFHLPPPLRGIADYLPGRHERYVGLWSREQMAEVLDRPG